MIELAGTGVSVQCAFSSGARNDVSKPNECLLLLLVFSIRAAAGCQLPDWPKTTIAEIRTRGLVRRERRHGRLRQCAPSASLARPAFLEARTHMLRLRRLTIHVAQPSEEASVRKTILITILTVGAAAAISSASSPAEAQYQ